MSDLISRQAAIDICRAPHMRNADCSDFEMAIMMLPPAELGTNLAEVGTDCISRQAAIDRLTEYGNGRAVFISVGEAIIRIEQLPPAQPGRIKGHWIPVGGALYKCDKCGVVSLKRKFCSECGADMEETT